MEPREWQKPTSEYFKDPPRRPGRGEPPVQYVLRTRPRGLWARYALAFLLGASVALLLVSLASH